jgi:hypothetical protein
MRLNQYLYWMHLSLLFTIPCGVFAEPACPKQNVEVVIFYGNGIDTTRESAQQSLDELKKSLGNTYNSQPLQYDLAYNQTGGMAVDLLQSMVQVGEQESGNLMAWLNNLGVMPDWFKTTYQNYLQKVITIAAPEIEEHAQRYSDAIARGQKVLVVSHSQGNLYVNEAKKRLAQLIKPEDMKSFGIMGVATPAGNVGGAPGPYLTNHRDIIHMVPFALPFNWTLRSSSGGVEDVIDRIVAHSFVDTYMSDKYDIKAELVKKTKAVLGALQSSTPGCNEYVSHIVNFFSGTYPMTCTMDDDLRTASIKNLSITGEGTATLPFGTQLDFFKNDVAVSGKQSNLFYGLEYSNLNTFTWDSTTGKFYLASGTAKDGGLDELGGRGKSVIVPPNDSTSEYLYFRPTPPSFIANRDLAQWSFLKTNGVAGYLYCYANDKAAALVPGLVKSKNTKAYVIYNSNGFSVNGVDFGPNGSYLTLATYSPMKNSSNGKASYAVGLVFGEINISSGVTVNTTGGLTARIAVDRTAEEAKTWINDSYFISCSKKP